MKRLILTILCTLMTAVPLLGSEASIQPNIATISEVQLNNIIQNILKQKPKLNALLQKHKIRIQCELSITSNNYKQLNLVLYEGTWLEGIQRIGDITTLIRDDRTIRLGLLYMNAKYRRNGFSKILLMIAIEITKVLNIEIVGPFCVTTDDGPWRIEYYKKFGCSIVPGTTNFMTWTNPNYKSQLQSKL